MTDYFLAFAKVKPADLSFNLAVQKYLAMEQASKDVQVLQGEQGPGISVNILESVKFGTKVPSSHYKRLKVPEVRALDSPSLVTDVQNHITLITLLPLWHNWTHSASMLEEAYSPTSD